MKVDPLLAEMAEVMFHELERNQLEVVLVPSFTSSGAEYGRKIRAVVSTNPEWYKAFCADFIAGRSKPRNRKKPDTLIKRQHTLRALREIAGGRCRSLYAERLLPYVIEEYGALCKRYKIKNIYLPVDAPEQKTAVPIPF